MIWISLAVVLRKVIDDLTFILLAVGLCAAYAALVIRVSVAMVSRFVIVSLDAIYAIGFSLVVILTALMIGMLYAVIL